MTEPRIMTKAGIAMLDAVIGSGYVMGDDERADWAHDILAIEAEASLPASGPLVEALRSGIEVVRTSTGRLAWMREAQRVLDEVAALSSTERAAGEPGGVLAVLERLELSCPDCGGTRWIPAVDEDDGEPYQQDCFNPLHLAIGSEIGRA